MGLEFFQANKNSFFSYFFKRSIFLFLKNFKLLRFYPQRRKAVQCDINTCFADIRKVDKCFSGAMRRHRYPLYWICRDIDFVERPAGLVQRMLNIKVKNFLEVYEWWKKMNLYLFFFKIYIFINHISFYGSISLYFFINRNIRYYLFRYFL